MSSQFRSTKRLFNGPLSKGMRECTDADGHLADALVMLDGALNRL